jgi:pyridoxine 5-phosphate synthase
MKKFGVILYSLLCILLLGACKEDEYVYPNVITTFIDAETDEQQQAELARIIKGAEYAAAKGLVVNAGHGLNLDNVAAIAAIPQIHELNIGHSIIADSVFVGLTQAVTDMKAAIQAAAR